jgi:RimJ/RimL family protein N-acetyltransferase
MQKKEEYMKLRKVQINDWKILLDWRNDIETRRNSHNMELVKEDDHKKWLKSVLENKSRELFIALENKQPCGTVRVDFDEQQKTYELSWTISPYFRGQGIGKKMVRSLTEKMDEKIRAEIKKGNIPSVKIAEYAGLTFKKEENGILHYSNY